MALHFLKRALIPKMRPSSQQPAAGVDVSDYLQDGVQRVLLNGENVSRPDPDPGGWEYLKHRHFRISPGKGESW